MERANKKNTNNRWCVVDRKQRQGIKTLIKKKKKKTKAKIGSKVCFFFFNVHQNILKQAEMVDKYTLYKKTSLY
jgi:hypothetical protein